MQYKELKILSNFENHENYNCVIELDTGEKYYVYSNWIHNQGLDHWKDWKCNAGLTRFYIDKNFNIWDGECKNTLLGNISDEWQMNNNTICHRDICNGCTDDLLTKKHA